MNLTQELDKYQIKNYTINPDGTIDVKGSVHLYNNKLDKIPFKFNKVSDNFFCYYNNLNSLEGCPKIVGGDFDCSHNKLSNLNNCPKEVGGNFLCINNNINNLDINCVVKGEFIHNRL